MFTVALARRLFLITVICFAGWRRSNATPIIVGRTTDGFLIGSNFTSSDGTKLCKVHYSDNRVLIIAGQPVKLWYKTPPSSVIHRLFNIEEELTTVPLSTLPPQKIMVSVRTIIENDVLRYAQYITKDLDIRVGYMIALVSVDIPQPPQLWIEDLEFSKVDEAFTFKLDHPEMQTGRLMEIVNTQEPQFKTFPQVNQYVIAQELMGATQRHILSSDPSYQPPYMVLDLSPKGVHFLTNDFGLCTGTHPVY